LKDSRAPRFRYGDQLRHAAELMQGILSGLDCTNCWTIAEHGGHPSPDRCSTCCAVRWDATRSATTCAAT
jgi:hypothetical protein